jgi:hypothetical protein
MVMDDNPYQSPRSSDRAEPKPGTWHPLTWALIGFAGGTGLTAPFVLSLDMPTKIQGGMLFGGIIGATLGLAHGISRRR